MKEPSFGKRSPLLAAILLLALLSASLRAQDVTVVVKCPAMPVNKISARLWQCQKEVSIAQVTLKSGEVLDFPDFTIPPTYVRGGLLGRAVDPCVSSGAASDGSIMILNLPREPVLGYVAVQITATGTLKRPSGEIFALTVVYPNCVSRPVAGSVGRQRMADAVTATGTGKMIMSPNGAKP